MALLDFMPKGWSLWRRPASGRVTQASSSMAEPRRRKGMAARLMGGSPLTRKIVTFNLLALNILVLGLLYINPSRDGLVAQRISSLVSEARLISNLFEAELITRQSSTGGTNDIDYIDNTVSALIFSEGLTAMVLSPDGEFIAINQGKEVPVVSIDIQPTPIMDSILSIGARISEAVPFLNRKEMPSMREQVQELSRLTAKGLSFTAQELYSPQGRVLAVAVPVFDGQNNIAVITLASAAGEIETLVKIERERVMQMFLVAILMSIGLSLVLASTISNPIRDLAAAAELGRDRGRQNLRAGRIRIPDMTGRPDEIGRLSSALRGMVTALYDRIDANEQFAADVSHEIKNPLASLRSAVGTLRFAKTEDQMSRLLDVIEHDVKRLDRLVSDISNASRLDSELVKEEEEPFDLLKMLSNLTSYLGEEASKKGIEFMSDYPSEPINIHGLEARLAQVFVNLISNAVSFCHTGDAIRVWVRRRDNRVLVVVEDTGPGIPEEALTKVFKRFYSQRPESDFGNNSGLGLAISKQIIEAHGGVIWAENIKPSSADPTSEPLGARFVVGLPI